MLRAWKIIKHVEDMEDYKYVEGMEDYKIC
jgi:hypothetical protein